LGTADETHVSEVDVLVFGSDSKYLCYASVTEPSKITGTGSTKTFDVDLSGAGNIASAYVMVVANAHADVNTAVTSFTSSTTKETAMQSMTFASSGKWNVTGNSNFTPLPMWGMTDSSVSLASASSIPSISLLRSVARIDVGLKFPDNVTDGTETAAGLESTFTLEEIYLYNSLNKGSIAPYSGKYSGTTATAPSIPTSPDPGTNNSPVPSYLSSNGAADGFSADKFSCTGAIYMAEHAAGTDALTNNPYLVIGGKCNGSGTVTYYRLDFVNGNYPDQEFLPVLRNHRYRFNITGVAGPGYTSADLASTRPVNMAYTLDATDESLASYVYDGQYALGVSQDSYTLDKASTANAYKKNNNLKVSATYANYTIAVAQTGSWLTMSASATGTISNTVTDHTFTVTENSGSSDRTATITVTSGRLKKDITVIQKGVGFSVTNPEADPYPATGGAKTLTVTSSYPWYVKVTSDPNAIITYFLSNGTGSSETFNFTLVNNSSNYYIPSATFTFFSPTGEFQEVSKTVRLQASTAPYTPSTTHKGWAGSNIYWNGTKLTFADTPSPPPSYTANPTTPETYQGVFFKWGSLIGLDPSYSSMGSTSWGNSCKVYVPTWNSGNNPFWTVKNASAQAVTTDGNDDTGAAVSPATFATWGNIPYVSDGNTTDSPALPYLTKDADTNLADGTQVLKPSTNGGHIPQPGVAVPVEKMKGDICRYLTQTGDAPGSPKVRWRMPYANEFSGATSDYATNSYRNNWGNATGSTVNSPAGIYESLAGYRKTNSVIANYQPWFSAGGDRLTSGELAYIGFRGYLWESSPGNSNAYYLDLGGDRVYAVNPTSRLYSFPVRCVKE
jgi:hypothetical protein